MRKLIAISIFLAAAASAAAEPPVPNATVDAAALPASEPAPTEPAPVVAVAPAAGPLAADAATAPAATPPAERNATAQPTPGPAAASAVPQVPVRKVADDTVCRRERPTGSLISVQRCFSRSGAARRRDDELLRSDLDHIREQENDRQARDAANAMAGRRLGP